LRLEDVGDAFALRRNAANPWETLRFRKTRRPGQTLAVRLRDGALLLLRDAYRLARLPARLGCVVDLGANVGLFAARSLDEVFARDATLARVARIHGEYHDVAPEDPRKPNLGLFFAAHPELAR